MLQVKYIQFSPRCRKSHVKQQIQYELTCFYPFLATRCLHVANDFRVYSQLSLPICRLSAYTLCYFLNPKFQASSHLLWLHSPVCVGPGQKPRRPVFSQRGSYSKTGVYIAYIFLTFALKHRLWVLVRLSNMYLQSMF